VLFLVTRKPVKIACLLGFYYFQPHLDGGYTVFGRVNETDMKIVDNLVRGDKILSVKIVEGNLPVKKENEQRRNQKKYN
jgi:cyclophilin family peptidyl-prolyl cis-trans isomerase